MLRVDMACGWSAPEAPGSASPGLLLVYRRTRYHAAGVPIRIGRRADAALDQAALGRPQRPRVAVLLTAWNPLSRRRPEGWNRRMQHRLADCLRRSIALPAEGALHAWHEAHVLVVADPRPMLRLARRFRQRAVVVLCRGRPARLVLLRYDACSAAAK